MAVGCSSFQAPPHSLPELRAGWVLGAPRQQGPRQRPMSAAAEAEGQEWGPRVLSSSCPGGQRREAKWCHHGLAVLAEQGSPGGRD